MLRGRDGFRLNRFESQKRSTWLSLAGLIEMPPLFSTPWENHRAKIKPRALTGTAHKIRLEQSDLEISGDRIGGIKRSDRQGPFVIYNGSLYRVLRKKTDKVCINMIA